jgi:predicted O-linked N-acetylglucosamine transferase (SPINDLY family)
LWLHGFGSSPAAGNLRRAATAQGIDPARLVFADRLIDKADHLARLAQADLFLDCLTVNAATTALDALWAGVPVLTVLGDSFFSRMSASMLHAAGLAALIMPDLASYRRRAVALAGSPELASLRRDLALARDSSPLFDGDRLARELEWAYAAMLARHQAGLPPGPIWVPPL